MMAIARHQPLTAWPPSHARKRPVKAAYTSAMMLQMLAQHSTHAKSALAIRAGDCVASIGQLAHAASDRSQEAD